MDWPRGLPQPGPRPLRADGSRCCDVWGTRVRGSPGPGAAAQDLPGRPGPRDLQWLAGLTGQHAHAALQQACPRHGTGPWRDPFGFVRGPEGQLSGPVDVEHLQRVVEGELVLALLAVPLVTGVIRSPAMNVGQVGTTSACAPRRQSSSQAAALQGRCRRTVDPMVP